MNRTLILASQSPRRKELLQLADLDFVTMSADVDETLNPDEQLTDELMKLALKKADAISKDHPGSIVLGADTTVVLEGVILGKPKDDEDARKMLRMLSGKTHEVITACALRCDHHAATWINSADVEFYDLSEELIEWYIGTNEHKDKAGSYGIQGKGALLVKEIRGDFYTVMGLPIAQTIRKLKDFMEGLNENEETKNG